ncbi:HAD family hydrolase [bacterium]|nr:HAD family hydrolase [bacterium]
MRKALFLDRDGVVNVERNYTIQIEDFQFIEGIHALCSEFQERGYLIFVITNQAGIARGYYTEAEFQQLTDWMLEAFESNGIHIEKVYHCPHHPDFGGDCECRKPNPGMILQAKFDYNLDLAKSILIGDKESDLQAGRNAGIGQNILFNGTKIDHQIIPWQQL